jgi:hypothetical protein
VLDQAIQPLPCLVGSDFQFNGQSSAPLRNQSSSQLQ